MICRCFSCGKDLDCSKSGECWSDNPNALTHSHLGGIECRDCYSKTHPFCRKCDKPMDNKWIYCSHCGEPVKRLIEG